MDVESQIRQVVIVLARDQPHDLAEFPFGKVPPQPGERFGARLLRVRQFGCVIQRRPLGFAE